MSLIRTMVAAVCAALLPMSAAAQPSAPTPWARADVVALGERVADYQLAQLASGYIDPRFRGRTGASSSTDPSGWVQATLFIGMSEFADLSGKPRFAQAVMLRGQANEWKLGDTIYHGNDYFIGRTYFWARRHGAGDGAITQMRARQDATLAAPPTNSLDMRVPGSTNPKEERNCFQRWCWLDALFMAPQTWVEMSNVTGDPRYAAFAKKEYWNTADYLYDAKEHLFYRDSRFFDRRDKAGRKIFWSRGNGWLIAGLAHLIPLLPKDDPDRPRFVARFREVTARLKATQRSDGYWSMSLIAPEAGQPAETSGTAFHVYAMAWGVNAGVLDRATYEPAIRKGWAALARSVHPSGKVGWVQPIAAQPENVTYDDTEFYGAGGFLMAATEVAKLDLRAEEAK